MRLAPLLVLAPALLCSVGCRRSTPARRGAAPPPGVERLWVPLSKVPLRGPPDARVTIVVFCDFQSRFCAQAADQLRALRRRHPRDVRVQHRHHPLPIHPHAQVASEAAAAANEQGQFWRFHDLLYSRQERLDRASLERYAAELGLDLARFRQAIDSERARLLVDADSILAAQLKVRGAPAFFVNGRPLRGPVPLEELQRLVEEERAAADALLARGAERRGLYRALVRAAPAKPGPRPSRTATGEPGPMPRLDPAVRYRLELGDSPWRGAREAMVTIVLWSDFECSRCSQFERNVLATVMAAHAQEVRLVWKFRPAFDHLHAILAAEAALAAGAQGKFWEMHDAIFARPLLEREQLEELARRLGLDMARFRAALDDRRYSGKVLADLELSERLLIPNLPTVFVNGRALETPGLKALEALVKAELESARRLLARGVSLDRLYDTLMAKAVSNREAPLPPLPDTALYRAEAGDSPARGSARARVTLIAFEDFQCPYCWRLEKTLARLRRHYGERLRVVWKDAPKADRPESMLAHQAARAAGEQGRFWEMHDKIFARPFLLSRPAFERYAAELSLDLPRFRRALDAEKHRRAILEDAEYLGSLVGDAGTPAVFVNGRYIDGAQPFEIFRRVIDEALTAAPASR